MFLLLRSCIVICVGGSVDRAVVVGVGDDDGVGVIAVVMCADASGVVVCNVGDCVGNAADVVCAVDGDDVVRVTCIMCDVVVDGVGVGVW